MEKVRSCMINIISKRELSNSVIYELDDNILRSNIISILKMFENGKHKFGECSCSTWDEDGHVMRPCFHSIEELKDVNYPWAGSTNQRVIDVQKSLKKGKVILHESN